MTEKLHYEVRFIETDDGYRLEATGDKEALKKLGIGPNMLNKKRRGRVQRSMKSRRGRGRGRGPHGMARKRARRAAMARRRHAWQRLGDGRGRWHMRPGPRRGFRHFYGHEARPEEEGHRGATGYL